MKLSSLVWSNFVREVYLNLSRWHKFWWMLYGHQDFELLMISQLLLSCNLQCDESVLSHAHRYMCLFASRNFSSIGGLWQNMNVCSHDCPSSTMFCMTIQLSFISYVRQLKAICYIWLSAGAISIIFKCILIWKFQPIILTCSSPLRFIFSFCWIH